MVLPRNTDFGGGWLQQMWWFVLSILNFHRRIKILCSGEHVSISIGLVFLKLFGPHASFAHVFSTCVFVVFSFLCLLFSNANLHVVVNCFLKTILTKQCLNICNSMNAAVVFSNVNAWCGVLRTSLCDPSQRVTRIYIYIYIYTWINWKY